MSNDADEQLRIARKHIDHQWHEMQEQQRRLRRKMWIILAVAIVIFIVGNILLYSSSEVLNNVK
jgi:hypothetical protein